MYIDKTQPTHKNWLSLVEFTIDKKWTKFESVVASYRSQIRIN